MTKTDKLKDKYVDRDVSWMYFNYRILQEAEKESVPLLERLSFLGIYSNNLDEFFRVRVASLNRIVESEDLTKKMRQTVKKNIKTISNLTEKFNREYTDAIQHVFKELELHNIRLRNETQLNDEQKVWLRDFYYDKLNGSTNPIWLNELKDFSGLEDNRIYLIVEKTEIGEKKSKYAIIKVPDKIYGRFIKIPSSDGFDNIMYLDDVVRFCLPIIFIGFPKSDYRAYSFKFTKDAEMEVDNDADYGMMERIALGVNSRKHGEALRVIYDREMPQALQKKIKTHLYIKELDTIIGSERYQNHKDLMDFPDCGHSELRYPRWKQVMKLEFMSEDSILDLIREKDRFIHVPYHSFNGYIRLLREAALKPEVKEIKTTLYRLAKDSKVIEALICAARNGKKVTAVVELLARFDEESNIMWSKRMQEEGVNVIFGVEGLKVHSKLLYIKNRKERTWPYIITFLSYLACIRFFVWIGIGKWVILIALGTTIGLMVISLVNLWWKISAHMSGMGGLCGSIFAASFVFHSNPVWLFISIILLSGFVAWSRLELNAHTPGQLTAGFLVGCLGTFLPILFV